jgi:hypothetical protein
MRLNAPRFVLPAVAILAVSLCAASLRTMAEEPLYPDRPLTMVVTFTAGGSSDVLARAVADATSRGLGKQVAVDNRENYPRQDLCDPHPIDGNRRGKFKPGRIW